MCTFWRFTLVGSIFLSRYFFHIFCQCCGFGIFGFAINLVGLIRIQVGKICPFNAKWGKVLFWSAGCSLLRAKGFSRSLDILDWGLGISMKYFKFWSKIDFFSTVKFCMFRPSNPWIRISIRKTWSSGPRPGSGLKPMRTHNTAHWRCSFSICMWEYCSPS